MCRGEGKIITNPCQTCAGKGKVRKNTKIKVNIPAGIDDGQTISLRGEGEPVLKAVLRAIFYKCKGTSSSHIPETGQ